MIGQPFRDTPIIDEVEAALYRKIAERYRTRRQLRRRRLNRLLRLLFAEVACG